MRTYIKKLQSKPENTRKKILASSLVFCMVFVGFVWVKSLGYTFNKNKTITKQEEEVKPFTLLKKSIEETFSNVTASVGDASSTINVKKEEITKIITSAEIEKMEAEKASSLKVEKVVDLIYQ